MRKVFLLFIFSVLLLTGCSSVEKLTCDIGTTTVTVTVKSGQIISYVDKLKGDLDSEKIEQLNEFYLKDITSNTDAINKLRDVIATMGGNCK